MFVLSGCHADRFLWLFIYQSLLGTSSSLVTLAAPFLYRSLTAPAITQPLSLGELGALSEELGFILEDAGQII